MPIVPGKLSGKELLQTLPPPPQGRTGWPWTKIPGPTVTARVDEWPKISIVTPSYNQAQYLEETIRSVLLQGYPALEYIIIDGGSSDASVEIIEKYSLWLHDWISETDQGQGEAIDKGFAWSSGRIYGYLNSDDVYHPNVLFRIACDFLADKRPTWHAYPVEDFDIDGHREIRTVPIRSRGDRPITELEGYDFHPPAGGCEWNGPLLPWVVGDVLLHQPGVFWRAEHHAAVSGFDNQYHYGFDHKFFVELLAAGFPLICHGGKPVTRFRYHPDSKTVSASRETGVNPFSDHLWKIARDLEPALNPADRRIVRDARNRIVVSRIWRLIEADAPISTVVRMVIRAIRNAPEILGTRFFWGSVARLAGRSLHSSEKP